jgi:hypothetical protein
MRKDLLRLAVRELAPLWVPGLLVAVCIGWCAFGADIRQYLNRKSFDPAVWKQAEDSDRYDLGWDLYHGRLDGLTPADLQELLGEPSAKEPDDTHWYYHLGAEKYEFQIGPAAALLHVAFENGRVVRVYKSFN